MKDNWIKPFQERLGDYEMDVAVPAAMPGRRKVLPWLLPAAAAAALALFLLLPGRRSTGNPLSATQSIAEALPQVQVPQPDLSASRLLPLRSLHPSSVIPALPVTPAQNNTERNEPTTETAPVIDSPSENTPASDPVSPGADKPVTVTGATEIWPDLWPEEPVKARSGGFSAKLYAGNFSTGEAQFQSTPDITSMKNAMAEFAMMDSSNDGLFGNSIKEVKHAVNVTEMPNQETVCDLPLKAGISFRYDFSPHVGIESGLTYGYHHAKQAYSGNLSGSYYRDYRMHYIGIPLKANFTLTRWDRAALYLNLGGEAELLAGGSIVAIDGVTRNSTAIREHPFQFAVIGGAGAEFFFTRHLGLYAEPGLAWHPEPSSSLPSYYRDHPWSFDLRVGLRLRLN